MSPDTKNIDFTDDDFIELPDIPKGITYNISNDQMNFINRGSCDTEPVELQVQK